MTQIFCAPAWLSTLCPVLLHHRRLHPAEPKGRMISA
jgi:hypothetical protein